MKRIRPIVALLCTVALSAGLSPGCATEAPFVWVDELADDADKIAPYRLQAGDSLRVSIWKQEELTGDVLVRPDGNITLPLIGDVSVVGLTPEAAAKVIQKRLDGIVRDPRVTVAVLSQTPHAVTLVGEVRNPGRVELRPEDTILDVLARAGGPTEFARKERIFLVRPGQTRVRFSYTQLTSGQGKGLTYVLVDGDIIVVE